MESSYILTVATTVASLLVASCALVVSWPTAEATTKQAEIAEASRKSNIRPYVTAYTRQEAHQDEVYLFIDNVGSGAAKNVRARIISGADFEPVQGNPLKIWKALREPISILRTNERLWTVLLSGVLENTDAYKDTVVSIELTYSDIEGKTFPPEEFRLDLFPNDGALFTTKKRFANGSLVEEAELRPNF